MMTYPEVMQVKYLDGQGLNVSAIAREMGKDRKTVRKILKGEGRKEKGEEEEKASILDLRTLGRGPLLSTFNPWSIARIPAPIRRPAPARP